MDIGNVEEPLLISPEQLQIERSILTNWMNEQKQRVERIKRGEVIALGMQDDPQRLSVLSSLVKETTRKQIDRLVELPIDKANLSAPKSLNFDASLTYTVTKELGEEYCKTIPAAGTQTRIYLETDPNCAGHTTGEWFGTLEALNIPLVLRLIAGGYGYRDFSGKKTQSFIGRYYTQSPVEAVLAYFGQISPREAERLIDKALETGNPRSSMLLKAWAFLPLSYTSRTTKSVTAQVSDNSFILKGSVFQPQCYPLDNNMVVTSSWGEQVPLDREGFRRYYLSEQERYDPLLLGRLAARFWVNYVKDRNGFNRSAGPLGNFWFSPDYSRRLIDQLEKFITTGKFSNPRSVLITYEQDDCIKDIAPIYHLMISQRAKDSWDIVLARKEVNRTIYFLTNRWNNCPVIKTCEDFLTQK